MAVIDEGQSPASLQKWNTEEFLISMQIHSSGVSMTSR
jgi:hypothetical protein